MSGQTLIQFWVDKQLRQDVEEIYEALGMDLPTAFRMFMTRQVRGLPFEAMLPENTIMRAEALNAFSTLRRAPGMTLDEINEEIAATREESNK